MTAPRRLSAPTGLRPGDHVCWTFADDADLSAAVLAYLDEGRRRGEQLLLVGESGPALLAAVADLPGRDAMLADGQLEVRTLAETYTAAAGLAPDQQAERYRGEVRAALRRGRPGLRVAADATPLAADPSGRRQLHAYEQRADVLMGSVAMTALCLYHESSGADALGPLAVLHPGQRRREQEPLAHLSGRGPGLSLHGEVDLTQAADVARALVDVAGETPGEVVLDLACLAFLDVAGARALAGAVRDLAEHGVRVRLVGARRPARRCLDLFAPSAEPPEPAWA